MSALKGLASADSMRCVYRLDRAFVGEFFPPFVGAWFLFTGVLVFSGVLPSLQYIQHPPALEVATWLLWQFPVYAVQSMPIAVAFAAFIAMGRMARHRELFAMEAGGVGARRPVAVLTLFGIALVLVGIACNQWVVPMAAMRVTETWWPMVSGQPALHRLAGNTWFVGTGDLYARRVDGHSMLDVRYVKQTRGYVDVFFAPVATFEGKDLRLDRAQHVIVDASKLPVLGEKLQPIVEQPQVPAVTHISTTGTEAQWVTRYSGGSYEDGRSWLGLWASIHNPLRSPLDRAQDWVTFYRKLAESLANVALLVVALPLAIRFADSSVLSFSLTLGTSVVWYIALAGTELAARSGAFPPSSVSWLPFAAFLALGCGIIFLGRHA